MHSHHHHPHQHPLRHPRGPQHDGDSGTGRGSRHEHGHGPRHEGPAEHQARRRERMFEAGGLKLLALHLIAQQPSHGYDIIRAIGELVGGEYTPSPGTIYPTLSYLVDMGHATSSDLEGGRKQYAITTEGLQALKDQDEALQNLLTRLERGKDREGRKRPAPLVRALENFKTALRLKLDGQPGARAETLTPAQIEALASILDQAALQIEKV